MVVVRLLMPVKTIYSEKEKPAWSYDYKRKQWRGFLLDCFKFDGENKPFKRIRVQYARREAAEAAELEIEIEKQNARAGILQPKHKKEITLKELLDRHKSTYTKHYRYILADRVYKTLLSLVPDDFKVTDLKPSHLQTYVDRRAKQVKAKTVNHELGVITPALKAAYLYFAELTDYQPPPIPRIPNANRRRERLVTDAEKEKLLNYLRRPRKKNELDKNYFHRARLADWIEFAALTGFRRGDTAAIKKTSFDAKDNALIGVMRHKQGKVTPYFPLTKRAAEIIKQRIRIDPTSEYIFTPDGKPIESHYRTLKEVCKHLKIPYGKTVAGGFVMHDLKRNFATDMQQVTDIATLRELTSNSSGSLNVYLNTSKKQMREAMRKMEKIDLDTELITIFDEVKADKISREKFIEAVKNLFGNYVL